jgi:hypothetical protein
VKQEKKYQTNHPIMQNAQEQDNQNRDPDQEHERHVNGIINNGGYHLNQPGSEGYYTRSHHFLNTDEWDSVFSHLVGHPYALYDTSDFIHDLHFSNLINGGRFGHESFPEVVYIPLPSCEPGFKRCILHAEEVNAGHPTGRYIPVIVKYHVNHPIARAITQLFEEEAHRRPLYHTKEELLMLTSHNDEWIRQMCQHFVLPGNDFDLFNQMHFPRADHSLPDPEVVERANREVVIPDCDVSPIGFREGNARWLEMVYPQNATAEQRREMYATFAAEQVNMHRVARLQLARDYPNYPNPIELPRNIVLDYNIGEHICENNPVDRNQNGEYANLANRYIQTLYDAQNHQERARIASMDVRLPPNQIG